MPVPPHSAASPAADAPVRLSVCIPAYNRPAELRELLDSIAAQDYPHYDVVVCEDHSPERAEIRAVIDEYRPRFAGPLHYYENAENLGYDANYRELIRRAQGEYCFVMGNDDVVAPGALATVAGVVRRTPDVGVILRSLAYFRGRPAQFHTIARYAPDELRFPPGIDAITQFYRRAGIISGLVVHRESALAAATDQYDGLVYYQVHLVASILWRRPGVMIPEVLAYYREGAHKAFGTSPRERGRFTPGDQNSIPQALRLMDGLLSIARGFDAAHGTRLHARVLRDMARHSYSTFSNHGEQSWGEYLELYRGLVRFGFWRHPLFHVAAAGVAAFGPRRLRRAVFAVRRRLGYTPSPGERPRRAEVLRSPGLGTRPHLGAVPGTS